MNVSRTPALEKLVNERVTSGRHGSASEVVREALRVLEERDRLRAARLKGLRNLVDEGLAELGRGEGRVFDDAMLRRIRRRGRALLAKRKRA